MSIQQRPHVLAGISQELCTFSGELYERTKGFGWTISEDNLGNKMVQSAVFRTNLRTLKDLGADNVPTLHDRLTKIERRLTLGDSVIQFYNGNDVDPRLKKAILNKDKSSVSECIEKIYKYMKFLSSVARDNPSIEVKTGFNEYKTFYRNCLEREKIPRVVNRNNLTIEFLRSLYPDMLPGDLERYFSKGQELTTLAFFYKVLRGALKDDPIHLIPYLNSWCIQKHEQLVEHLNESRSLKSLDQILEEQPSLKSFVQDPSIAILNIGQENTFYLPVFQPELLKEFFLATLRVKAENNLKNVVLLIELGERGSDFTNPCQVHLSVCIDEQGIIYLFNPNGDCFDESKIVQPFASLFSSFDWATDWIYGAVQEQIKHTNWEGMISITGFCNAVELIPENDYLDDLIELDTRDSRMSSVESDDLQIPSLLELTPPAHYLQEIIYALSSLNEEGFYQSIHPMTLLDNYGTLPFPEGPGKLKDRICYQLYHLHCKEKPEIIDPENADWGATALQSDLATPEEKLRAAQRVQAEFILLALGKICTEDQLRNLDVSALFNALEGLAMDKNDAPQEQINLAYYLFGKIYHIYTLARKENPDLIDPQDEVFKNDFGRNAFVGHAAKSIDVAYKLEALRNLRLALKQTWAIQ